MIERHYTAAALITSQKENGIKGIYSEPAADISMERFAKTFIAHIGAFI